MTVSFLVNVTIVSAILTAATLATTALARDLPSRIAYLLTLAAFVLSIALPSLPSRRAIAIENVAASAASRGGNGTVIVWGAGAGLLALFYGATCIVAQRRRRRWSPASRDLRARLAIPQDVALFVSSGEGLATHGMLRPVIVADGEALDPLPDDAVRCLARHELAHVRWHDPLAKAVVRLACIVLWPALPLWVLAARIARAQEIAADDAALREANDQCRTAYADALVDIGSRRTASFATGALAADRHGFTRRIARVIAPPKRSHRARSIAALALFVLAAGIAPAAQLPARYAVVVAPTPAEAPLSIEAASIDVVAHREANGTPLALPLLTFRNRSDRAVQSLAFRVRQNGRFIGAIREAVNLAPGQSWQFRQPYGSPPNLHLRREDSTIQIELLKVELAGGGRWGNFGDPTKP